MNSTVNVTPCNVVHVRNHEDYGLLLYRTLKYTAIISRHQAYKKFKIALFK